MFLPTEQRNSLSTALHELQAEEILELINDEDSFAVSEAKRVIPTTAELVRVAIDCISSGGSVHYYGAGTSGRIATQDAAELYPTFHTPPEVVQAHMAGGVDALLTSVENAEDDVAAGASDASGLGPKRPGYWASCLRAEPRMSEEP
jgi:N-acetylmuramic acid 6-phosphate etherase